MGDFFANLPPWLGTVPQLFSAGGIMGILYILTQGYLGRTKNVIEDKRVAIESDKIEGEIEAKLRDHFAAELKRLREEISDAKKDVQSAKERQTQCEEREQALRGRVRKLEDQLTGIVRSLSVAMHGDSQVVMPLLTLKEFDQYTTTHALNVSVLAMALAEFMGLSQREVRAYGIAAIVGARRHPHFAAPGPRGRGHQSERQHGSVDPHDGFTARPVRADS